jgi:hypothetical protein
VYPMFEQAVRIVRGRRLTRTVAAGMSSTTFDLGLSLRSSI